MILGVGECLIAFLWLYIAVSNPSDLEGTGRISKAELADIRGEVYIAEDEPLLEQELSVVDHDAAVAAGSIPAKQDLIPENQNFESQNFAKDVVDMILANAIARAAVAAGAGDSACASASSPAAARPVANSPGSSSSGTIL